MIQFLISLILLVVPMVAQKTIPRTGVTVTASDCIGQPCSFSTNIAYDALGTVDTRPNTWGRAAYTDTPIPFVNVPVGYRVRIKRLYGDVVAWPHGTANPNTVSGLLAGLLTSSSGQSPFVAPGMGSAGCFWYIQGATAQSPLRIPFDTVVAVGGLLDPDNVVKLRQAIFMNETGVSIHMETTLVMEFQFEAIAGN